MPIINLQKKAIFIAGLPMKGFRIKIILGNGFDRYKRGRKTMSFLCLIITMLDLMHVRGFIEFCMANCGLVGFMVIMRYVQITCSHVY